MSRQPVELPGGIAVHCTVNDTGETELVFTAPSRDAYNQLIRIGDEIEYEVGELTGLDEFGHSYFLNDRNYQLKLILCDGVTTDDQ